MSSDIVTVKCLPMYLFSMLSYASSKSLNCVEMYNLVVINLRVCKHISKKFNLTIYCEHYFLSSVSFSKFCSLN